MIDLLRDGVWQFVGAVVSVVALVVAVVAVWIQVRRKSFVYSILADNELLHRKDILGDRVTVHFDSQAVSSLRLVSLQFSNDGYVAIAKSDFESPVTVSFPIGAKVLSAIPGSTQPEGLPVELSVHQGAVVVSPLLLNRDDSFTVQVILTGASGKPKVTARLLGVKEIKEQSLGKKSNLLQRLQLEVLSTAVAVAIVGFVASGLFSLFKLLK